VVTSQLTGRPPRQLRTIGLEGPGTAEVDKDTEVIGILFLKCSFGYTFCIVPEMVVFYNKSLGVNAHG
jgi:hypothetical protein